MFLLIDNYDSFTYNLYAQFTMLGAKVEIIKNDQLINADKYEGIIISPGPSNPKNAGYSLEYIKRYKGRKPIFGVCLGMQSLGYNYGYEINNAATIKHGKKDKLIYKDNSLLFKGVKQNTEIVRYHSLAVDTDYDDKYVTSKAVSDNEVMSFEDIDNMIFGVQFHPESILSEEGSTIVENFIKFCKNSKDISSNVDTSKLLKKINSGMDLTFNETRDIFTLMMKGELDDVEITSVLISLKHKGETPLEISAALSVLKNFRNSFDKKNNEIIDTCGTGGDGKSCMNVSSAVSLVLASMGHSVVKHGNKAQSGKVGSADIFQNIGIPIDMGKEQAEEYFEKNNFVFLFAPNYHPALKNVGKIRKKLKVPTIFNLLGPLANPTDPDYQIIGISDRSLLPKIAEVVKDSGNKATILYSSYDGYDEVSTNDKTEYYFIKNGIIEKFVIDPSEYFKPEKMVVVKDDSDADLFFMRAISGSDEKLVNLISLNTALALKCLGTFDDMQDGFKYAKQHITEGNVIKKLRSMKG